MAIYNMIFSSNNIVTYNNGNGSVLSANILNNTWTYSVNGNSVSSGTLTETIWNNDGLTNLYTLSDNNGEVIFLSNVIDYTNTEFEAYPNTSILYRGGLFPVVSTDIDTKMGENYYEEDLTTNVKKYFAEAFKFDGSQFEMDGDRIVGLKQSFIDSLATDLTNIVNTSITTATLTADVATINQTLTALGINTDLLKTKDLRLVDAQGHEHKLHLGN